MNANELNLNIEVIGGDGAFSYHNSSFLIKIKEAYNRSVNLLFDCSENAFQYISNNKINVDYVFISHTHQDHIGGLEKLIYWNYFVNNKKTKILAHKKIELEKYLPEQIIYENGEIINVNFYELSNDFIELKDKLKHFEFDFLKGNHIIKENYGIIITLKQNFYSEIPIHKNHCLIITGDTKASSEIKKTIKMFADLNYDIVVFHDYQLFGSALNSVHCCKEDFEFYYKDFFGNDNIKWFKYHNTEFDELYRNKNIQIISYKR